MLSLSTVFLRPVRMSKSDLLRFTRVEVWEGPFQSLGKDIGQPSGNSAMRYIWMLRIVKALPKVLHNACLTWWPGAGTAKPG